MNEFDELIKSLPTTDIYTVLKRKPRYGKAGSFRFVETTDMGCKGKGKKGGGKRK